MDVGLTEAPRGDADVSLLARPANGVPARAARSSASSVRAVRGGAGPSFALDEAPQLGGAGPASEGPEDLGWEPIAEHRRGRRRRGPEEERDGPLEAEASSFPAGGQRCAILGYSKGQRDAAFSRRTFSLDFSLACAAASWTVVLSLPVLVWPWGDTMAGTRFRMAGFGSMLLQYLYSVYWNLGTTMKLTIQGILGTSIAYANVLALNALLRGGAYADRVEMPGGWLPLCSHYWTEAHDLGYSCLAGGVLWHRLTILGSIKLCITLLDFVLVVVLVLALKFDDNTRTFALSTHVYFVMSFVNPNADTFQTFPTSADCYAVLVLGGSCAAVMCVLFSPRRRALNMAEDKAREASETVAMVLEALPLTREELTRQKVEIALAESEATRQFMEQNLEYSWFEDFGRGRRAKRRRRLRSVGKCLLTSARHVPGLLHAAAALSQEDVEVLEGFDSLQSACAGAHRLLLSACTGEPEEQGLESVAEDYSKQVSADFVANRRDLSPEACAFMFMICGVLSDVTRAVEGLLRPRVSARVARCTSERLRNFARSMYLHFGMQVDRSVTHPRFVLRNTCSICITFALGWVGLWKIFPSYASTPASTVSLVIYTYTGASVRITLARLNGVVLGKVIGTLIQISFAARTVASVICFAFAMWFVVAFLCYIYFHVSEHSYVSCLSVAYAAQSMIPDSGTLAREAQPPGELEQNLIVTIQEVVIGVAILTIVDLLAASRASKQARRRLQRCFRGARDLAELLGDAAGSAASTELCITRFADFLHDLDALRGLIPHAAKEPVYGGEPFKTELYEGLESHLRAVAGRIADIEWATRIQSHRHAPSAAQAAQELDTPPLWLCRSEPSTPVAMDAAQLAPNQALDDALCLLFSRLRRDVVGMLRGVEALAAFVTQDGQSLPVAAQSLRAAWRRRGRTAEEPRSLEAILQEPQGGGPPMRRRLTRLLSQGLEDASAAPARRLSASVTSRGAYLETLFVGLRLQLAASNAELPHHDELCRFEVVLLFTRLLVGEVRKIELALMEY